MDLRQTMYWLGTSAERSLMKSCMVTKAQVEPTTHANTQQFYTLILHY